MEVRLSPERNAFIRRCVDSGRFQSANEVIEAALKLLAHEGGTRSEVPRLVKFGLEQIKVDRGGYVDGDAIRRRASRQEVPR